ncbi:MAG TPA: hypothetical protein VHW43_10550 [Puia sp.]|jgi:hypothetical protein|nr:hypothetical protein [Puia sp.]
MTLTAESPDHVATYSIELSNGASALREVYYTPGTANIFSYPPVRNAFSWASLFLVVSEYFYQAAASNRVGYIVCFMVSLVLAITFLATLALRAVKYLKWKKGVDVYLREVDELGNQQLKLNPTTFELINKKETVIEKWSGIKKASITPQLIRLNSESGSVYSFPAKTMEQPDYQVLQDFVRRRMHTTQDLTSSLKNDK